MYVRLWQRQAELVLGKRTSLLLWCKQEKGVERVECRYLLILPLLVAMTVVERVAATDYPGS